MRNVLLIARNFAPVSHVSAERATKLAKYLPRSGWCPTVLTGARPTAGLTEDPALLDQVAGVRMIRTRAPEFSRFYASRARGGSTTSSYRGAPRRSVWHPKAWLVPDSQVLWYPFAVQAALRAARACRWDAVVATTFPPTALLIAHTVAARLRIPYVADFRDAWTTHYHAPRRAGWLAELERRLERRLIRDAAAVVAVDARFVEHAFDGIPPEDRPPLHVIRNGYDEDDFAGVAPAALPRFSIVHTGQLRHPPRALWAALQHAMIERPELHGRVHLWQVGFVEPGTERVLNAAPAGVTVHQVPPVPQREAIGFMLGADLLLVEEYGTAWPSKTMQYLRASRPILAFVPRNGMIREVLETVPQAHVMAEDESARAGRLIADLDAQPRGAAGGRLDAVAAYSRREIAARFASVLDAACERRGSPDSGERVAVASAPE
jgi:glycosyltransferase involved in cell wall biosynthesis